MDDEARTLWNIEEPVGSHGIEVPGWVEPDIDGATVAAIVQGGCDSGAYMPAVTYHEARKTMEQWGDELTDWLAQTENNGPLTYEPAEESWSAFCCRIVSRAVETWAWETAAQLTEELGLEEL